MDNVSHRNQFKYMEQIFFSFYLLCFPLGYISVYNSGVAATFVDVFIVAASYFLILLKKRIYPVVFLIVYARCINGFIVPGDLVAFKVLNFLTGYFPLFLSVLLHFRIQKSELRYLLFKRYWITCIYIVLLLVYLFPNLDAGLQLFIPRVAPMLMLIAALIFLKERLELPEITAFFRVLFISCILVYLAGDYLERSYELLASGAVFSKPLTDQSLVMLGVPRMLGSFWDFRIQGIFGVIFALIALMRPAYRLKKFDVCLAGIVIILSMSRGAIVLAGFVGFGYLLYNSRSVLAIFWKALAGGMFLVLLSGVFFLAAGDYAENIVASFDVFGEKNALSQRGGFREYATVSFLQNPIGGGIGAMKAEGIDRQILVGEVYYDKVSDAFIFIQLAEIGVLGFTLFVASLFELLHRRNLLTLGLLGGLLVQMTGTDIPDMGIYYFLMLFLLVSLLDRYPLASKPRKYLIGG